MGSYRVLPLRGGRAASPRPLCRRRATERACPGSSRPSPARRGRDLRPGPGRRGAVAKRASPGAPADIGACAEGPPRLLPRARAAAGPSSTTAACLVNPADYESGLLGAPRGDGGRQHAVARPDRARPRARAAPADAAWSRHGATSLASAIAECLADPTSRRGPRRRARRGRARVRLGAGRRPPETIYGIRERAGRMSCPLPRRRRPETVAGGLLRLRGRPPAPPALARGARPGTRVRALGHHVGPVQRRHAPPRREATTNAARVATLFGRAARCRPCAQPWHGFAPRSRPRHLRRPLTRPPGRARSRRAGLAGHDQPPRQPASPPALMLA